MTRPGHDDFYLSAADKQADEEYAKSVDWREWPELPASLPREHFCATTVHADEPGYLHDEGWAIAAEREWDRLNA